MKTTPITLFAKTKTIGYIPVTLNEEENNNGSVLAMSTFTLANTGQTCVDLIV